MKIDLTKQETVLLQRVIYSYLNNFPVDGTDSHRRSVSILDAKIKNQIINQTQLMTREEKIKELRNQISQKRAEIAELEMQLCTERVAAFKERHNMIDGQHFMYEGAECAGFEASKDGFIRTHKVLKSGAIAKIPTIIYNESNVKPL